MEAGNVRARLMLERAARDEQVAARKVEDDQDRWRSLMAAADHRELRRADMAALGVSARSAGTRLQCRPSRAGLTGAADRPGVTAVRSTAGESLLRYSRAAAAQRDAIMSAGGTPQAVAWENDYSGERTRDNPRGLPISTVTKVARQ
jgi:hypothetical protein